MKKNILNVVVTVVIFTFIAGVLLTSCTNCNSYLPYRRGQYTSYEGFSNYNSNLNYSSINNESNLDSNLNDNLINEQTIISHCPGCCINSLTVPSEAI